MAIEAVKQLPNESTRATRYSPSLVKALKKLIARMSVEIVKLSTTALSAMASLNRTLATLFCELFDVMDRGSVFEVRFRAVFCFFFVELIFIVF